MAPALPGEDVKLLVVTLLIGFGLLAAIALAIVEFWSWITSRNDHDGPHG
jgi:hypothetical protein